jgi:DNA repair exonuclease SbcCD ATPase subunit
MNDGKLFYFIDKTKPTSDQFYKVAMLKKFEGDVSFFDAPDQKFTKGWILDTKEFEKINQAITSYMNSKYSEQIELYKDKEKVRLEKARIERERRQAQINEKLETANVRREDDEWDPEILDSGDLGSCAWALYTYLVNEGEITPKTPESTQRLEEAKVELEQLQETYANIENANEITDLVSDIESLEEEIRQLEYRKDVYNIIPLGYRHYDLYALTTSDFDREWYVGDSAKTERSAIESVRSLIDDVGLEGFNNSFVMGHFDDDRFRDYLREFFEEDVYNNPEAYLEDSDKKLSRSQEARIIELRQEISQLNDELNNLDDEDEEYDSEYERIENEIQEKNDEIEEIESDPDGDYDDDKLESVVDDRVSDYRDDAKNFYDTFFGGGSREYDEWAKEFIDEEALIQDVVDTDGYGHTLNSWDGSQEEVYYNGEGYYLFESGDLSI